MDIDENALRGLAEILGSEKEARRILEEAAKTSQAIEREGVEFRGRKRNIVRKKAIACPGIDFVLAKLKMIAHQLPNATKTKLRELDRAWEAHKTGKAKINVPALAEVLRRLAGEVGDKGLREAISQCAVDLDKLESGSKGQKSLKGLTPINEAGGWLGFIDERRIEQS